VLLYPIVGLVIGSFLFVSQYAMGHIDSAFQAAILLTIWVGLTGALHIDGLADLVDAWVGSHGDKSRMMEIMKDATSGPMAVTAIVLLLLVKFAALSVIIKEEWSVALFVIPLIGRAGLLAALRFIPYVRPNGLGAVLVENLPKQPATRILWACALFVVLVLGWPGVGIIVTCLLVFYLFVESLKKVLGGLTGDCAGAICELMETFALVALVILK